MVLFESSEKPTFEQNLIIRAKEEIKNEIITITG